MAKKLTLDDLKVQSFVTTLKPKEARELVGGTRLDTDCAGPCTTSSGPGCSGSHTSNCCDTQSTCTTDEYACSPTTAGSTDYGCTDCLGCETAVGYTYYLCSDCGPATECGAC